MKLADGHDGFADDVECLVVCVGARAATAVLFADPAEELPGDVLGVYESARDALAVAEREAA